MTATTNARQKDSAYTTGYTLRGNFVFDVAVWGWKPVLECDDVELAVL
jgi:hypothetical protein